MPGLPYAREASLEPVIGLLEREHAEFGPVIGWDDEHGGAHLILATDADDAATAAQGVLDVVCAALRAAGPAGSYPTRGEVELVDAEQPAVAA